MNTKQAQDTVIEQMHADISALADGQLRGEAFARTLDALEQKADARATWHAYHLIGDVMRSAELGDARADAQFVSTLRTRLAQERPYGPPQALVQAPDAINLVASHAGNTPANGQFSSKDAANSTPQAANDSYWKLLAGLASLAAVVAVVWGLAGGLDTAPGGQLAGANNPANPNVIVVSTPSGDVLRDARLVEMMAAHKQFGGTSALQMPSGFLRNATFDPAQR